MGRQVEPLQKPSHVQHEVPSSAEDGYNVSAISRSSSAPLLRSSTLSGLLVKTSSPPLAALSVVPSGSQCAPHKSRTDEDVASVEAGNDKDSIVSTLKTALLGGRAWSEDVSFEASPVQVAAGEAVSGDESREAVLAALRSVLLGCNTELDQEAASDVLEALAAVTTSPAGEGAVRLQLPNSVRGGLARRLRALKARQAPLTRMPQIDEARALDLEVNVTFVILDDRGSEFFKLALNGAASPEAIIPYGNDRTALAKLQWRQSSEVLKSMAHMPEPESEEQALTTAVAYVLWSPHVAEEEEPASSRERAAEDPLAPLCVAESLYRSGRCPPRRFLVAAHRGMGASGPGAGDAAREEVLRRVIARGIRPLPSLAVEEGNPKEIGSLALHLVELLAVGLRTWRAKTSATAVLDESCADTATPESGSRLSSRPSSPEGSIRSRDTGPGRPRAFDAVGAAAAAFDAATAAASGAVLAPRSLRVHDAACIQAAA